MKTACVRAQGLGWQKGRSNNEGDNKRDTTMTAHAAGDNACNKGLIGPVDTRGAHTQSCAVAVATRNTEGCKLDRAGQGCHLKFKA